MSDIIISVSGVRGIFGDNLTPQTIVRLVSSYCSFCEKFSRKKKGIVVGRDGRLGGKFIEQIATGTIALFGYDVVNIGTAPTPTVQIATEETKSAGGISITASHNPQEWNGLKFLKPDGTFLDKKQITEFLRIYESDDFTYAPYENFKNFITDSSWIFRHIERILELAILDLKKIRKRNFRIVVDAVNASGSEIVPELLKKLGCSVIKLYCGSSGLFPHKPEPLPENLNDLSAAVVSNSADMGIAVDPDADRLVLITDTGEAFGEENTIAAVTDFVLRNQKGSGKKNVTVNLSTTRAVEDIAAKYNAKVYRSAVGEINVVNMMRQNNSVIGGEGSGGIIYPKLHYGRDSLAGIALILNELADYDGKLSDYKKSLPKYHITKTKIDKIDNAPDVLKRIQKDVSANRKVTGISIADGLKIDFKDSWVHLRKSNTEPVIRIIAEAPVKKDAVKLQSSFAALIRRFKDKIN